MKIQRAWFEHLIFRGSAARRFTQDSPVLPDVWIRYAETYPQTGSTKPKSKSKTKTNTKAEERESEAVDLILTPHRDATPAELARELRRRLNALNVPEAHVRAAGIAHHMSGVVARLGFEDLVQAVLPLSAWWGEAFHGTSKDLFSAASQRALASALDRLSASNSSENQATRHGTFTPDLLWTIRIIGTILLARGAPDVDHMGDFIALSERHAELVKAFAGLVAPVLRSEPTPPLVWTVSRNRTVSLAVSRSRQAVKADAAQRLFEIDTRNLAWAVLDTGIDAEHPAFQQRSGAKPTEPRLRSGSPALPASKPAEDAPSAARSRIVATFDFTYIRDLLNPDTSEEQHLMRAAQHVPTEHTAPASAQPRKKAKAKTVKRAAAKESTEDARERARELTRRLQRGAAIDWEAMRPSLQVPHDAHYRKPTSEHGTHVAGILAGRWERVEGQPGPPESLIGMCPDLNLYDFRVFGPDGLGDEFTVMAALQFIRHLNAQREQPVIHGVNLSLSLAHDVANYACGQTPICDECDRVVSTGVVVVAAAGNDGYMRFTTPQGDAEGYRSISISDPGNAELVITVGATHRYQAHTYGVSYFSSRGPTGDGRQKPDLVAPGEKITAPIPDERWDTKDGTSMAAPHVSGAAALLMARHRELVGRPQHVKDILCKTATDLGRERYFQGSGMVDILRALQSV